MNLSYAEKIEQEIKQMPVEYLPALFNIVHIFRESVKKHSSEISLNNKRLLELEGKINWEGDLEQMRTGRNFDDTH